MREREARLDAEIRQALLSSAPASESEREGFVTNTAPAMSLMYILCLAVNESREVLIRASDLSYMQVQESNAGSRDNNVGNNPSIVTQCNEHLFPPLKWVEMDRATTFTITKVAGNLVQIRCRSAVAAGAAQPASKYMAISSYDGTSVPSCQAWILHLPNEVPVVRDPSKLPPPGITGATTHFEMKPRPAEDQPLVSCSLHSGSKLQQTRMFAINPISADSSLADSYLATAGTVTTQRSVFQFVAPGAVPTQTQYPLILNVDVSNTNRNVTVSWPTPAVPSVTVVLKKINAIIKFTLPDQAINAGRNARHVFTDVDYDSYTVEVHPTATDGSALGPVQSQRYRVHPGTSLHVNSYIVGATFRRVTVTQSTQIPSGPDLRSAGNAYNYLGGWYHMLPSFADIEPSTMYIFVSRAFRVLTTTPATFALDTTSVDVVGVLYINNIPVWPVSGAAAEINYTFRSNTNYVMVMAVMNRAATTGAAFTRAGFEGIKNMLQVPPSSS